MITPKMIPSKTYNELMEENLNKIPIYTDEWTNYNPSDPGITILENLTAAQVLQQNAMDEVPEDVRAKLLKLLGYTPKKCKGARVYVQPMTRERRIPLLADQKFLVGDLCFETNRELTVTDCMINGVYGKREGRVKDVSHLLDYRLTMRERIFGKKPKAGAELYLVMDKPLAPGEQGILHIDVAEDYGRNPFSEAQTGTFATTRWECYTAAGFVPMTVQDGTSDFLMSGEIVLTQPDAPGAYYEDGEIKGYVFRVTLEESHYDVAPALQYISGFLFPLMQKETRAITHNFHETSEVTLQCNMLEDGYISVYAKEQKGSSYRKYEECVDANYHTLPTGRYYRMQRKGHGEATFSFDRDSFGFAPVGGQKNTVKVVIYNEEMMRKYYLGEVYGYDNQEIKLPVEHVVTETFCIIARRDDGEGGYLYDFLKPNKMDEKKMSYYLFENEGKIVIRDAGDYIGASLYLGSVAVTGGEDGNVRRGNVFTSPDLPEEMTFFNPAAGSGGVFQETLEQVRRRFVADLNTPQTAVTAQDYEKLVLSAPGLCIGKAKAWRDDDRSEIQIAVKPALDQDFPRLSDVYIDVLNRYLDSRRLLSTSIRVKQPVYVPVNVSAIIYRKPHFDDCEELIRGTIVQELDYLHGEQNFGEALRFDRVFHALDALECVAYVYELKLSPARPELVSVEGADLIPNNQCLLYPGSISLEIPTAESD